MSLYEKRGVSAQKQEVHAATSNLSQGLFPHAFCKVFPDFLGQDPAMVNLMHADGAGTKSILAYLYWKETGDISVWKGIAQDAIVMNLDDLLCVGVHDHFVFNSTIDRNKRLISGDVLKAIIEGSQEFFDTLAGYGIHIQYLGGETADVGDVVRTVAVNGTMTCRWPAASIISNQKIRENDVIVGLASYGQSVYETSYNSGIGSNGLTSARHDALSGFYSSQFPESFDPGLPQDVVYIGQHRLTDTVTLDNGQVTDMGRLLLSPTRTFAPILKNLLHRHFDKIHGLIHCSGGGQTKCMKYIPDNVRIVKDNLFTPPVIFNIIQAASKSDDREMYQVFNMGTRLEIYTNEKDADSIISVSKSFGVDAQVIGRVEASEKKELYILTPNGKLIY